MQSGFGFGAGADPPPEPPDGLAALPDPEEDPAVLGLLELELPAEGLDVLLELEVPKDGLLPELEELPVLGFAVLEELTLSELPDLAEEVSFFSSLSAPEVFSVSVFSSAFASDTTTSKLDFTLLPAESTAVTATT